MILLNRILLKSFKIAGFLFFSTPVFAGVCDRFNQIPKFNSVINYGNVIYKLVDKSEIVQLDKLNNPTKTLGVTSANLRIKYDFNFNRYKVPDGVCVNIQDINFFIGYKNLDVFIDNKYLKDTCEYKAIMEHEKQHVAIYQEELKYYGNLLIQELRKIVENIEPVYFDKGISENKLSSYLNELLLNNPNVTAIKEKLEENIQKRNKELDTDSEYMRVHSMCKNW